ncbi:MAG: 4'-phosphopantetheinyl transferase superfamily protein [Aquabacterium sp.]|uniref:holo-ACP synthase n=1 Tax=Aquabacterium sp. TaxID=1872578 RepID=UPI0025B8D7B5|nr:4'-phosphopantetheinyl transferase superfamily protein [Aquabacterium sp.]MBI5925014.1 4'-phosphopantetheinyl transferase superfamily protein [Aquabacterium sp.]
MILAKMVRQSPDAIADTSSLGSLGLTSSFGLSALRSAIEKESQRRLPPIGLHLRVSELLQMIEAAHNSSAADPSTDLPKVRDTAIREPDSPRSFASRSSITGDFGVGLDMQEIEDLPETDDYRGHSFYFGHFSSTEIATALLRPDPRAHLCGIFCVKEAVKKSHAKLLDLRMDEILVCHDDAGKPFVELRVSKPDIAALNFRFHISITHTRRVAAATCLASWEREE